MKVVILAGGFGSRISEESHLKPKPMLEIGGKPLLWHIMKIYSSLGFSDFIICLGYKGYVIKEYFEHYLLHGSDVTFDFSKTGNEGRIIHQSSAEPWKVTLAETGEDTLTGGRLKRASRYLDGGTFMMTYGDGVADVDLKKLLAFHKSHGRPATVTAIRPLGRFGALELDGTGQVKNFREKPAGDGSWINGGFFVLEPKALDYIEGDQTLWEKEPLERLSADGNLMAWRHEGFWQPMDTLRDKQQLDALWDCGKAPWKIWK